MSCKLLEVDKISTHFVTPRGVIRAVDRVSFSLDAGRTLAIVGESGSGKSVLARSIMNLLPSTAVVSEESVIKFENRDVRRMSSAESRHFWGPKISLVFQDPMTSLNPVKRIGAQLTEGMRFHLGLSRREATARALDLLADVKIPEPRRRLDQYPHELSGGLRQRVAIAIAIACEPRLLIADEPTTALDVTVQKQILDLLQRLQAEHRMAMILITHDLGVVASRVDEVMVMYSSQAVEFAPTEELFSDVRHPYTEALLRATPRLFGETRARLESIAGQPTIGEMEGCRFAPRCRYGQDVCKSRHPALTADSPGEHLYRCFFPVRSNVLAESPKAVP